MKLEGRIRRLESRIMGNSADGLCHCRFSAFTVRWPGDTLGDTLKDAIPCERCGGARPVIQVVYDDPIQGEEADE
jgi:hypothetical protein